MNKRTPRPIFTTLAACLLLVTGLWRLGTGDLLVAMLEIVATPIVAFLAYKQWQASTKNRQ